MIFFGVPTKEALWLRMGGVPRIVASGLATLWTRRTEGEPTSYDMVRNRITSLSDSDWQQALPAKTALTPGEMRVIWQSFSGGR
jgi:hypothetical protein